MDIKIQGISVKSGAPKTQVTSAIVPTSSSSTPISSLTNVPVVQLPTSITDLPAPETSEVEQVQEPPYNPETPDYEEKTKAWEWLNDTFSSPYKHILNIGAGALLYGTNAITGVRTQLRGIGRTLYNELVVTMGAGNRVAEKLISGMSLGTATAAINTILDEMKNPNIEGIPIHADTEKETSDVTVAKNLYIRESQSRKEYAIDNTVPQPRTWTISGYLVSNPNLLPLQADLLIKPDLIAQKKLLQYYIDARRPVVFKTHDNQFFYTLITHLETQYTTQATNAVAISITLTEFNVMEVDYSSQAVAIAKKGGVQL